MNLSLRTIVTTFVAWTTIVAGATWAISLQYNENMRETIKSYEKSKNWKLPQAIEATEKASSLLSKHLKEIEDINILKKDNEQMKSALSELQNREKDLRKSIAKYEAQIVALSKNYMSQENITIKKGEAASFFENKLIIGVSDVSRDWVECRINNSRVYLHPGDYQTIKIGSYDFQIVLMSINLEQAKFSVLRIN
jgi:small-conductance mechanosensitive channel